jgi:hypothetical protein
VGRFASNNFKGIYMLKVSLLAVMAFMFGCAHGELGKVDQDLNRSLITKSTPIFVEPISTKQAAFEGYDENDGDKKSSDVRKIESNYASQIAKALREKGYNANAVSGASKTGVVITGMVNMIDRGSAAKRMWVGMGAGSSNLDTNFTIEDRTQHKVLSKFEIKATSGGRGGLASAGSFVDEHMSDGGEKVADFISGKK